MIEPKHLRQEYEEEFNRPEGSIRLLTEHQAKFIRALMRLNYFKKDKQDANTKTTTRK